MLGAQAGMNLGVWLLTWLGLGFLVVEIGRGLGEMAAKAQAGVLMAWEAQGHTDENTRVDRAADELADAVALLIQLILMAIVARLTYGQARAGNASAAASLDDLVASLRQSKLGAGFADWVALNAQRLMRNPKLQRQRELGGLQAVSEAQTPICFALASGRSPGKPTDSLTATPGVDEQTRRTALTHAASVAVAAQGVRCAVKPAFAPLQA